MEEDQSTCSTASLKTNCTPATYIDAQLLRDTIIGFSDGLTVPFALTAGLSSLGSTKLVILGGLAELFAGAISMGLGAWLATTTDQQTYDHALQNELRSVGKGEYAGQDEDIQAGLAAYGVCTDTAARVVDELKAADERWCKYVLHFNRGLERPSSVQALFSAGAMGISYFIGGLLPLIPYFAMASAYEALYVSIGITGGVLLLFGYVKCWVSVSNWRVCAKSSLQTLLVGAASAAASYGIVRAINAQEDIVANPVLSRLMQMGDAQQTVVRGF